MAINVPVAATIGRKSHRAYDAAQSNKGTRSCSDVRTLSIDQKMPMSLTRRALLTGLATLVPVAAAFAAPISDPQLDRSAAASLQRLIAGNRVARLVYEEAAAVHPPAGRHRDSRSVTGGQ
jgi:hypothetical protein